MGERTLPLLNSVSLVEDELSGFLLDMTDPLRPRRIQILVDGRQIANLTAGDFMDWRLMGGDFGTVPEDTMERIVRRRLLPAAFRYRIPDHIVRDRPHDVAVVAVLADGEQREIFKTTADLAAGAIARLKTFFSNYRMVDFASILEKDGGMQLQGWISIPETTASHVAFACNGKQFRHISIRPSDKFDRKFYFCFWPDRPFYEFEASTPLSDLVPGPLGYELTGIDKRTGQSLFPHFETILPIDWQQWLRDKPLPSNEQVGRNYRMVPSNQPEDTSSPDSHATTFIFTGSSHMAMLDRALQSSIGRRISASKRILDWGCGAGRLTQHLATLETEVHGADIDAENISWASTNIPNCKFQLITRDPPMPYPDGFFDHVIAISVFTHLSEQAQFDWLRELRRVVRPGGVITVTVAGWHSFRRGRLRNVLLFLRELDQRGISDSNIGNLLAEVVGVDSTYYRNTKHMPEYIDREWSRYFEIKGMARGALGGLQDIVVGVRPAD